jgi:uncharacterized protein
MPRRLIKRVMPDPETIRRHKSLQCLGSLLEKRRLWRLNRHSVALACLTGLFVAFIPVPFQMLLAAVLAIGIHANLPISVALVWVTNPLTMPPIFFGAYKVGAWMLGMPATVSDFHMTAEGFLHSLAMIWKPFLVGCLVSGLAVGLVGYIASHLLWRGYVVYRYRRRQHQRLATVASS